MYVMWRTMWRILIGKHLARSTRFTYVCTAKASRFQRKVVHWLSIFLDWIILQIRFHQKNLRCCHFMLNFDGMLSGFREFLEAQTRWLGKGRKAGEKTRHPPSQILVSYRIWDGRVSAGACSRLPCPDTCPLHQWKRKQDKTEGENKIIELQFT